MTRIRFYIGKVDRDGEPVAVAAQHAAIDAIAGMTGGATVYHTVGVWEGTRELSFVIEVLTEKYVPSSTVHDLAQCAAKICNQTAVMYTLEPYVISGFAAGRV